MFRQHYRKLQLASYVCERTQDCLLHDTFLHSYYLWLSREYHLGVHDELTKPENGTKQIYFK